MAKQKTPTRSPAPYIPPDPNRTAKSLVGSDGRPRRASGGGETIVNGGMASIQKQFEEALAKRDYEAGLITQDEYMRRLGFHVASPKEQLADLILAKLGAALGDGDPEVIAAKVAGLLAGTPPAPTPAPVPAPEPESDPDPMAQVIAMMEADMALEETPVPEPVPVLVVPEPVITEPETVDPAVDDLLDTIASETVQWA